MRALHVIGVDLQFRLGQKLTTLIQQQGLAELIAVCQLRDAVDQNLALKYPDRAFTQHLFEHLTAFTTGRGMGLATGGAGGGVRALVVKAGGGCGSSTDGGAATVLYIKETGSGNTGWVAK